MAEAKRDNNYIPTLIAVSNADGITPVVVYADPTTHRLLVSMSGAALDDLSDVTITSAAQGDILYHNGTAWVNLAAGTSGHFLKTQGASANPTWAAGGTGTVTSVSVVTANGISGSVATSTTTPAITLTLGVIVPTSVNGLTLAAQAVGFTIAGGTTSKTLTISNTFTLTATDGSTLAIGTGGTLGSAAYTASTAYAVALGVDDNYVTDAEKTALHAAGSDDTFTVANEATDTTCFPLFVTAATGDLGPKTVATLTFNSNTGSLGATTFVGNLTGDVTGNASGTAATVTGAAQANITSLGTLTTLTVDDITINGNTISSAGASTLAINPTAGQAITFDGTVTLDAGVVAGMTSLTMSGNIIMGANSITMTGSLAATGTRVTKGWFTDLESTNMPTVGGTAILTSLTAPTFTTIELGAAATDTTLSRVSAGVAAIEGVNIMTTAGATLTGNINLGEGADPATIGLVMDSAMSADERYSGITCPGTAGATLAFGDLCYLDVTATEWLLADADAVGTAGSVILGICVDASTDGNATSMLLHGMVRSAAFPASIALGAPVYVDVTAGDISATAPSGVDDVIRVVGWAVSAEPNTIYFNPSPNHIIHV